jgi:acetyl esterase/lipase
MSAATTEPRHTFRIERDIPYGEGAVGFGTDKPRVRPLLMDAYLPDGTAPAGGWPTLVLSHGGAFHRGAKDKDEFEQEGARNTPVHEYCELFAAKGHACFSVGYRLTQERLPPLEKPIMRNRQEMKRDRIDYVRGLMGLPPATHDELINGAEGTYTDIANAFNVVHANARRWSIDTKRMGIGGFSAGGFGSAYAVFALGVPATSLICFSSGIGRDDAEAYITERNRNVAVLIFQGESDLPDVLGSTKSLARGAERAGLRMRRYQVPGKGHFYDRPSPITPMDSTFPGGETCNTVGEAVDRFVAETL